MSDFLRRLTALSVCVTLAELLLPEGDTRRVARLALTLLVTLLLTATLMDVLAAARLAPEPEAPGALLERALATYGEQEADRYRETALTAWANQLAERCERLAASAGYRVEATAYLLPDGSVHRVSLRLRSRDEEPLYAPAALPERLGAALGLDDGRVSWAEREASAP